jgi:hypothetical protein
MAVAFYRQQKVISHQSINQSINPTTHGKMGRYLLLSIDGIAYYRQQKVISH